jgi:hypothetical protein
MGINIGDIAEGKCTGCNEDARLRYEGIQENPIKKTRKPMYTCMSCGTTRCYDRFVGGEANGS